MEVVTGEAQPQQVGQPQATEPQTTETAPEPKVDFATRFAHLSKEEKRIKDYERSLKERESKLKQEQETTGQRMKRLERETLLKNPRAFFEETGLTVEEFLQANLDFEDGKATKPDPLSEIEIIKKQLKERDDKEAEREVKAAEAQRQQAVTKYKADLTEFVKSQGDEFELVNLYGEYDQVYETLSEYYETNGDWPFPDTKDPQFHQKNISIAAKQLEDYFSEFVKKGQGAKRFAAAITEDTNLKPKETPLSTAIKENPVTKPSSPTLTNKVSVQSSAGANDVGLLSREESLKRAAQLLKFK